MLIKYKAGDLAKDLGVQNKELLEVITKKFGEGKKYTTPLTEQEILDMGVERREYNVGFDIGDRVKVIDGPLDGFFGVVGELEPEKSRVRVVVSMFGRETPVDLELDQVEPVTE